MNVLSFHELPKHELNNSVITIGKFDGVHRGHQQLISRVVNDAKQYGMKSIVLTFHPHPAVYFEPQNVPDPIISQDYKYRLIRSLGVDAMLTLSYDAWIASLSPESYVKRIVVEKLQAKRVWVGYDFSFGQNRVGNSQTLMDLGKKYGFQTTVLGPQTKHETTVSSTTIRSSIKAGRLREVSHLLGRFYVVDGEVIGGIEKTNRVGSPTLAINIKGGMIPGSGIYRGITYVDNREIASVLHVGNVSSGNEKDVHVEARLINRCETISDQDVKLAFIKRLRDGHTIRAIESHQPHIEMDGNGVEEDVLNDHTEKEPSIVW